LTGKLKTVSDLCTIVFFYNYGNLKFLICYVDWISGILPKLKFFAASGISAIIKVSIYDRNEITKANLSLYYFLK